MRKHILSHIWRLRENEETSYQPRSVSSVLCSYRIYPHIFTLRSDAVLFKFLEQYLQRLEGPLALQVWGRFLQLAKEIIGNARDFKVYNFLALR